MVCCVRIVAAWFVLVASGAWANTPTVYWSAEPVLPGDMAMLQGAGWESSAVVAVHGDSATEMTIVPPQTVDVNPRCVRFVLPGDVVPGVRKCTVTARAGKVEWVLNLPQPWWMQGDNGQRATPGGWLRVFGRCLEFGEKTARLQLRKGGRAIDADITSSMMWTITARIPKDAQPGEYEAWVHNGTGGESAWGRAGLMVIGDNSPPWKSEQVAVTDFNATPDDDGDDTEAFRSALEALSKSGGGVLQIPRGRFYLSGTLTIPHRVLIKGAGMALTHLVWKDTDTPPDAFLENVTGGFGIEDLSLYASNYLKGLHVHAVKAPGRPDGQSPTDISIRRIRARFSPFSIKDLSPVQTSARLANAGKMAVVLIYADNVKFIDCDLAWTSSVGFSLQGNDVLCRGNVARAEGGGWCPVGGGRRIICEGNEYSGITTGVTRGGEVWFASNRVSQQYRGDREGFTTDGPFGGVGFLETFKVDGREIQFTAKRPRDEPQKIPSAVRIVDGKGAGQVRMLEHFESGRLTMEREFDVEPDVTSRLWAANALHKHIVYGNTMSDTSIAVQFFGSALDCIVANNTSARSGGFRAWGNEMCDHVQFLGNTIVEGYGTAGREARAGTSSIHADGPWVYGFKGTTTRAVVMRGNKVENNGTILLHGSIQDVLVENNVVKHSSRGIVAEILSRHEGVVLRGNTFEDVDVPYEPANLGTSYTIMDPVGR